MFETSWRSAEGLSAGSLTPVGKRGGALQLKAMDDADVVAASMPRRRAMGQLQTKMVEDLQLRGYAPATCKEYVRCARSFVAYHMRPPTELGERDVRRLLLYLAQERKVGPATIKMHTAAIKFLYERTLDRPQVVARVPYIKVPQKLPDILSGSEVDGLLAALGSMAFRAIVIEGFRNSRLIRSRKI
jgi:site-specific recombinase XerD